MLAKYGCLWKILGKQNIRPTSECTVGICECKFCADKSCVRTLSGERCNRMASFSVVEWILVRVDARWFIVTDLVIDPSGLLCDLEQPAGGAGSLPNEVLATVMKELPLFKTVRYYHSDFDTSHLQCIIFPIDFFSKTLLKPPRNCNSEFSAYFNLLALETWPAGTTLLYKFLWSRFCLCALVLKAWKSEKFLVCRKVISAR